MALKKIKTLKINSEGLRMGTRMPNPKSNQRVYGDKGYDQRPISNGVIKPYKSQYKIEDYY